MATIQVKYTNKDAGIPDPEPTPVEEPVNVTFIDRGEVKIINSTVTINSSGKNNEEFWINANQNFTLKVAGDKYSNKELLIRIEETKTIGGLVISYDSSIRAINSDISTTGLVNSTTYIKLKWNKSKNKWDIVGNINLI